MFVHRFSFEKCTGLFLLRECSSCELFSFKHAKGLETDGISNTIGTFIDAATVCFRINKHANVDGEWATGSRPMPGLRSFHLFSVFSDRNQHSPSCTSPTNLRSGMQLSIYKI